MLVSWRRWSVLLVLVLIQVSGFLLFIRGFFPSKVVLPGMATSKPVNKAVYDKVIVMVVDAMRSDFMFSEDSKMSFVHQLINEGHALGFTAFSNPPTVTLPRLKGITTGSTPNFLDAILNIAEDDTSSTLGDQDSWVRQLHGSGRKIHMFGDDTWIKLFPQYFDKFEGTSSFYVSDFTEVDNNVTRHITEELRDDSWDCLILHYLGLDHIGHKGGPTSPNMPLKQAEMDSIIERLYTEYVKKNPKTLLVVLGDHGMNEVGNHGGSSIGETSAALLAITSKKIEAKKLPLPVNDQFSYYNKVQQIDLVPTLALLLNFPIPKNNLGIFIEDFKFLYQDKDYAEILMNNAMQMKQLVEYSFGKEFVENAISDESEFGNFCQFWFQLVKSQKIDDFKLFLQRAQSKLAESATNYDYEFIKYGLALFAVGLVLFTWFFIKESYKSGNINFGLGFILAASLLAISNFGSSLVEEEYQVWWWIFTIFFALLIIYLKPNYVVLNFMVILGLLRAVRGWNNSGQKFNLVTNFKIGAYLEDEGWNLHLIPLFYFMYLFFMFKSSGYFSLLQDVKVVLFVPIFTLVGFSLMAKLISIYVEDETTNATRFNPLLLAIVNWPKDFLQVNDFKKCLNPIFMVFYYVFALVIVARLVWSISQYQTELHRRTFFSDITNTVLIFLFNQSSPRNVLIFAVFLGIRYLFGRLIKFNLERSKTANIFEISLILTSFNILIQNLSFFSMGNTNSLSTVDLTNAFNGLSDYDLIACGLLTFSSNWAGPIFWSLSYLILILENASFLKNYKYDLLYYKMLISMTLYSIVGIGLLVSCVMLRFHLFIWTVFSPKLLYFGSWYIFMNLGVDSLLAFILIIFY